MSSPGDDAQARPETEPAAKSEVQIARELRLRSPRPPVVRLSRKVLIGGAGVAALAVGGASWWALDNHKPAPKHAQELYAAATTPNPPDKLSQLPHDYAQPGAVPKLGPPLPGDLGRPMLAAQGSPSAVGSAEPSSITTSPTTSSQPPVDPARQPAALAREAARTSRLFASMGEVATSSSVATSSGSEPGLAGTSSTIPGTQVAAPAAESTGAAPTDRKLAFLAGGSERGSINPSRLTTPVSPYLVQAGTLIDAALITGIRSDLPGQVTAQVTADVRDSVTGRWLLIPQGARLIGTYDSQVGFGQSRVLLAWTRLILPNGKSIDLGRAPAADRSGYAGLQDGVDHHWRGLFGAAALSTVLGVGADLGSSTTTNGDLVTALRRGSQDTLNRAGEEAVRRQLDVQPTLTIRPGHAVRIVVERDLVLEQYIEGTSR